MLDKLRPNRTPVVKQLELVTDIGKETPPDYLDLPAKNVDAVWKTVENLYKTGAYPAISVCIRKHGTPVINRAIGFAQGGGPQTASANAKSGGKKKLMRTKTPVCLFSASKAVTAILIFKLVEDGLVALDDPVADYIPEFAAHNKSRITIGQVLSHRSGFPWYKMPKDRPPEALGDWDLMLEEICDMPLQTKPGVLAYHAFTGGFILGEIIQRTSGLTANEYIHKHIAEPMGMKYFTFGLAEQHRKKVAHNFVAGEPVRWPISKFIEQALSVPFNEAVRISNLPEFMDACVPAGNLYATAEEVSRFYEMLLNGGRYNEKQILKPETVAAAISPVGSLAFDRTLMAPMQYSHGFMLGQKPVGMYGVNTAQAFGHIGFMNVFGWADPQRDLSAAILVSGKALIGTHLLQVGQFLHTTSSMLR